MASFGNTSCSMRAYPSGMYANTSGSMMYSPALIRFEGAFSGRGFSTNVMILFPFSSATPYSAGFETLVSAMVHVPLWWLWNANISLSSTSL